VADIVVDSLITKIGWEVDNPAAMREAAAVTQKLEEQSRAAAEAANKLGAEQRKLAENTDALTDAQLDLADELAATAAKVDKLKAEQRALQEVTQGSGKATDEQKKRLRELYYELQAAERQSKELREESGRLGRAKQRNAQETRKLAREQKDLSAASRKAAEDQRKLADAMRDAGEKAKGEAGGIDSLISKITGVAGGQLAADAIKAIGSAVIELGKEVITTGANFESLRARLKTVTGSSESAAQAFSTIQEFAKATPFEVENITTAFVALRVRGVNPTTEKLTALGDLSSAFGYGFEEMTDAIGAAARGELDPIEKFGIAAKVTGDKIKLSFKGQTEVVERSAAAVTDVLVKWGQMNGVQGAMAEQSMTTAGMFSNLKDTISSLFDQASQMGVLDEVKLLIQAISDSIGGEGGLAKLIADVLIVALRSMRELFTSMPQGALIEFFQALVNVVSLIAQQLVAGVGEGAGFMSMFGEMGTLVLDVAANLYELGGSLSEIAEKLDMGGLLDVLIFGFKLLMIPLEILANLLERLMTLLRPVLDELSNMADRLPSLSDMFSGVSDAVRSLAGNVGLLNDNLGDTATMADIATKALNTLKAARGDYSKKTTQELTDLRQSGDKAADAELRKRIAKNTQAEQIEEAEVGRKEKTDARSKRLDHVLEMSKHGDRVTDEQLTAIWRDPYATEKQRDDASKELQKREDKRSKRGKGKKTKDDSLTAEIQKQIDTLAKDAGKRAAARALLRNKSLSKAEVNEIEMTERSAVQSRLSTRFAETGALPPGLANDLVQTAALPNIEQTGGRLAPPVITINNEIFNITGNTFEAIVQVTGGVSATPQAIADAVVTRAIPVTHQSLGRAIQNSLTNERR
jgi:hypothetical protein